MKDDTGTDQPTNMNAAAAAAIMQETRDRAVRVIRPDHRGTFTVWGLAWFLGYGALWLAVRGQHPFHGPSPVAFAAVVMIGNLAALASVEVSRTETGVGGRSALRRRLFLISGFLGYAGMFLLEGALYHAGADRAVLGVFEAVGPILVTGLLYLARSSATTDWPMGGIGVWLVIVAAAIGYAGPEAVWGVGAVAVGPAFLLAAALQVRLHRS